MFRWKKRIEQAQELGNMLAITSVTHKTKYERIKLGKYIKPERMGARYHGSLF